MQPERELAYWPEFHNEIFFLVYDYGAHANCFVRADKPEAAIKTYLKWKEIDSYINFFEKFYHDCNCHLTEISPRTVQQKLNDEQLEHLQRDSVVCWDVSS